MWEHTATVRKMSAGDRLGSEGRSARGTGSARRKLPAYGQLGEGVIGLMRAAGAGSQGWFEQGGELKEDVRGQWRHGYALERRFVFCAFHGSAGVGGAIVFLMCSLVCRVRLSAAGERFKVGSDFQEQAMRRNRQPEDGQQKRQNWFQRPHVQGL
jgi:hypothetical protein